LRTRRRFPNFWTRDLVHDEDRRSSSAAPLKICLPTGQEPIIEDGALANRLLIFGDVHGCDIAFESLLNDLQPGTEDTVILLGDVVDRGPSTRRVLDMALDIKRMSHLVFVQGNHEEMMLKAVSGQGWNSWLRHGGAETLDSYGGALDRIPQSHWELIQNSIPYWQNESDICIHANLEPGISLETQSGRWLRWEKLTGMEYPHPSGKRVICGHSAIRGGLPTVGDGWVCIDTNVFAGGFLTCLEALSGEIIQARQTGAMRRGVYLQDL